MQIIIKVTQEHINQGERIDCFKCPVALAMKDAGIRRPIVYESCSWIDNKPVKNPDNVAQFIMSFDTGENVEPFNFELDFE